MNRAQRRRLRGAAADLETTRRQKEQELAAQARAMRTRILASDEPLAERIALVEAAIADFERNPAMRLFGGPMLDELRGLHDELVARAAG